jgi:hypothetical protein
MARSCFNYGVDICTLWASTLWGSGSPFVTVHQQHTLAVSYVKRQLAITCRQLRCEPQTPIAEGTFAIFILFTAATGTALSTVFRCRRSHQLRNASPQGRLCNAILLFIRALRPITPTSTAAHDVQRPPESPLRNTLPSTRTHARAHTG